MITQHEASLTTPRMCGFSSESNKPTDTHNLFTSRIDPSGTAERVHDALHGSQHIKPAFRRSTFSWEQAFSVGRPRFAWIANARVARPSDRLAE